MTVPTPTQTVPKPTPAPKIAVTSDRPYRLAPPPKPPKPGSTPEDHEQNLHTAVAAARDNPDAHTLSDVESHVAPLYDMDAPTAIKVASRVTGQQGLRRKSEAIDAVRGVLAPNRFNSSLAWGGREEHSAISDKDIPLNWSGVGTKATPQPRDKNRDAAAFRPAPIHLPNVDEVDEATGITKAARVGVPGDEVPRKIGRMPNLTPEERRHETAFRNFYEDDPESAGAQYRYYVLKRTPPGEIPSFETDDAKNLHGDWRTAKSLEDRAKNRAALNIPLHATANAIAKQAFLQHLDTLKAGDKVLVTNGGCGAGKGYSFEKDKNGVPNCPEAYALKQQSKAVWDSAGDQNGTENTWIKKELDARGLKGIYTYVHVNPKQSWANPGRGIVQRATKVTNGRMISGKVYGDSYAIGAQNMHNFHQANANDPNSEFMFLDNTGIKPQIMSGVHPDDLRLNRHELAKYAHDVVHEVNVPEHIKHAATADARHWAAGS